MSKRTLDPFYIDINLVSSVDLLQKMTSYVDLLNEFTDEVALASMYWHTNSHSDPITSKTAIFEKLNNAELKLKDNNNGVKKSQINETEIKNKNIRDQLPDEIHLETADSSHTGEPVMVSENVVEAATYTDVKKWVPDGDPNSPTTPGKWLNEMVKNKKTLAIENLPDQNNEALELSETFGLKDMSPWFIMHWLDKFKTAHAIIRADLKEVLGDDNEYFVDFSESVGQLKNLEVYDDASTARVWDYNIDIFGGTPPTIAPGVASYNIPMETTDLMYNLSLRTNQLYRTNMRNLMEDASTDTVIPGTMPSTPGDSHGNNLVNDDTHRDRMWSAVDIVLEVIETHLKGLYPVLEMLSIKENSMAAGKPAVIDTKVEDYTVGVDLLNNRIKRFTEELNITTSMFGKATKYGIKYKTDDYLKSR